MAEYTEVIKQFTRMCKSTTGFKCSRGECPVMGHAFGCENIGQCRKIAFERPDVFEEKVMAWAAENPEPVYPTWYRWLIMMGAIGSVEDLFSDLQLEIPADKAQELGIEPEEAR